MLSCLRLVHIRAQVWTGGVAVVALSLGVTSCATSAVNDAAVDDDREPKYENDT